MPRRNPRFRPSGVTRGASILAVRARLRDELRGLWLEPRDPRLLQLGFSLLFLLDMGLRVAGDVELRTGPMIGLVLVPVAWVVTLAVPWTRTPEWCLLALLVFDFGLVGLSRLDPLGGSALLVVLPALWLGFVFGVRGAVVTGVSTVLMVVVPGLTTSAYRPESVPLRDHYGPRGDRLARDRQRHPAGPSRPGADRPPAPGR